MKFIPGNYYRTRDGTKAKFSEYGEYSKYEAYFYLYLKDDDDGSFMSFYKDGTFIKDTIGAAIAIMT